MMKPRLSEQTKRLLEKSIPELRGKSINIVIGYIDTTDKEVEISFSVNDEEGESIVSFGPGMARVGDTIKLMDIDRVFDIEFI